MADNYLENRMEEYRSGRLASRSRTSVSMRAPRKNNQLTLTYPPMSVIVFALELDDFVAATVAALAGVGCKVAFTAQDAKESNLLAQRTGSRYYPGDKTVDYIIDDVTKRWTAPDVVVSFVPLMDLSGKLPVSTRIIDVPSLGINDDTTAPEAVARHVLYLSHPDNAFLI